MLRGLDVSQCQGRVDWKAVADLGCRFAFVKCSEGNKGIDPALGSALFYLEHKRAAGVSGQDPLFDVNVARARAAGLYVGPYHFAYPLPPQAGNPMRDPEKQAKFAYDLAAGLGSFDGDLPPMLDLEWPAPADWGRWGCDAAQIRAWALACLDAMAGFNGCTPLLYTYPDFWRHIEGSREGAFARYPLVMASYPQPAAWPSPTATAPTLAPWASPTFWQITGGEMTLPGGAPADYDVFLGGEAELAALCRRGPGSLPAGAPTA